MTPLAPSLEADSHLAEREGEQVPAAHARVRSARLQTALRAVAMAIAGIIGSEHAPSAAAQWHLPKNPPEKVKVIPKVQPAAKVEPAQPGFVSSLTTLARAVSPVELPAPHRTSEENWEALKEIAWTLELTGPRCPWITDYRSEMNWVRKNWREARDCPPLSDCERFPPSAVMRKMNEFNANHRLYLLARREVQRHEWDELSEVIGETDRLREIWQVAADARSEDHIWVCRRRSLRRLKELVGDEMYGSGTLPPVVPVWRFQSTE